VTCKYIVITIYSLGETFSLNEKPPVLLKQDRGQTDPGG
jgi:hypothetical protein